jgi:hypothetical protein
MEIKRGLETFLKHINSLDQTPPKKNGLRADYRRD